MEGGAAEQLLLPNPSKKGKADHAVDENEEKKKKKKKRHKFAEELKAAANRVRRTITTRSMTRDIASSPPPSKPNQPPAESLAPEIVEEDLTERCTYARLVRRDLEHHPEQRRL